MKHVCGRDLGNTEVSVRLKYPYFLRFNGRVKNRKLDRVSPPDLIQDENANNDLKKIESYDIYCPSCGNYFSSVQFTDDLNCICGDKIKEDQRCELLNRFVCDKCYATVMSKVCATCPFRKNCVVYIRNV